MGVTYQQSYVARWDFRNTPLLAGRTAADAPDAATLTLYLNPTAGAVAVAWQLPPGTYLVRLPDAGGAGRGRAQRLVVE